MLVRNLTIVSLLSLANQFSTLSVTSNVEFIICFQLLGEVTTVPRDYRWLIVLLRKLTVRPLFFLATDHVFKDLAALYIFCFLLFLELILHFLVKNIQARARVVVFIAGTLQSWVISCVFRWRQITAPVINHVDLAKLLAPVLARLKRILLWPLYSCRHRARLVLFSHFCFPLYALAVCINVVLWLTL